MKAGVHPGPEPPGAAVPTAGEARKIAALMEKIAARRARVSRGSLITVAAFLLRCADRMEALEPPADPDAPPDGVGGRPEENR